MGSLLGGGIRDGKPGLCRGFWPESQEIVGVEFFFNHGGRVGEIGLELADWVSAAFHMRVVTGEEVKVLIGVIDESCNILIGEGCEAQLFPDLLTWGPLEPNGLIDPAVNFSDPI